MQRMRLAPLDELAELAHSAELTVEVVTAHCQAELPTLLTPQQPVRWAEEAQRTGPADNECYGKDSLCQDRHVWVQQHDWLQPGGSHTAWTHQDKSNTFTGRHVVDCLPRVSCKT